MKKTVFWIMVITIVSKIFGFGREITLSFFYGASEISDAYIIAVAIPGIIFGLVSSSVAAGYIPIYSRIKEAEGTGKADEFTSNIISTILVLCTVAVSFGLAFTEPLVRFFASGFEEETFRLTVGFTRISLFAVYFTGVNGILKGFLQLHGKFFVPALTGFPFNAVVIISIILSFRGSSFVLAAGYVLSVAAQFFFMLFFVHRTGYRHNFRLNLKDGHVWMLFRSSAAVFLGMSVNQLNIIVDRMMASSIAVGGVTALTYANQLNLFFKGVFITSLVSVLYPKISAMAAEMNHDEFRKTVAGSISAVNILAMPAAAGLMVLSAPIVELLFVRGAFDSKAADITSSALFFYGIGIAGYGLREILVRAFYSIHDTKTPMKNAIIGLTLNIVLDVFFSRRLGIGGLALATSVTAICTTLHLIFCLRGRIGAFGLKKITFSFIKILAASGSMAVAVSLVFGVMSGISGETVSLFLPIGFGVPVYFAMAHFLKIEEILTLSETVKKKFGLI